HQELAGFESDARALILGLREHAYREIRGAQAFEFTGLAAEQRRHVAGIDVLEPAHLVENPVKHGGVAIFTAALAKILIDAREDTGERNVHRRRGEENALQQ